MKKISTLYKKDPKNLGRVINEIDPANAWVFESGIPTRKFDGTSCAIIGGELYKRYGAKLERLPLQNYVGETVVKASGKPFRNGSKTAVITEIDVQNYNNPKSTEGDGVKLDNGATVSKSMLRNAGFNTSLTKRPIPEGAIPCQDPDIKSGHYPHWVRCSRDRKSYKYHFIAFDSLENKEDGTYELCGNKVQGNPEAIEGYKLIPHGKKVLAISDFSFEGLRAFLEVTDIEGIVFHERGGDRMCKIRKKYFGIRRQI